MTYISWSSDFALYLQDYLMDADHTWYTYFHSSTEILRLRHDYFVHETDEIFTAVCRVRVSVFFKYTRTVWPLVLL